MIRNQVGRITFVLFFLLAAGWPGRSAAQTDNTWFSNGPAGQIFVLDILFDPQAPDTMFAGTFPGTVFRSLNRGASWAEVGATIADTVSSLGANRLKASVMYAASKNRGVFKSVDRGVTWSAANTGLPDRAMNAIAVDPVDTGRVFTGSLDSLFVSTNSGISWSRAGLSGVNVSSIAFHPQKTDTVYVGTDGAGVYRTRNGGASWAQVNTGLGSMRIAALAVHPDRPDTVYAATLDAGLYKSTNGGASWAAANNGLTVLTLTSIAISPSNPNVLYVGTTGPVSVFKSADNAETWVNITKNLPAGLAVGALAVRPDSANVVYAGLFNVQRLKQVGLDSIGFYSAGPAPHALAAADLDGNGAADILAANRGTNTVSVYLNQAQGALLTRRDFRAGSGPVAIRAADLDGDGDLDLATANRDKQTVSVLFNDSTGVFSSPVDFFIGAPVSLLALADVDADRDVDLVAADDGAGTVRVFLNDGAGSFGAPKLYPVAPGLSGLAVADFTGNGLLDIAVLSRSDGRLYLLSNPGNAAFSMGNPIDAGAGPAHLVAADFDLDGDRDLVSANSNATLSVFLNDGSGGFSGRVSYALPDTVTALAAADLDGDRYPDLVTPRGNGTVAAAINDGNAAFTTSITFGSLPKVGGVFAADLDGDGRREVGVARPDANGLTVYANRLTASIKGPGRPRRLRVKNRQGDLGGSIDLSWERARADEETGRITGYRVYRSESAGGTFGEIARVDTLAAHTKDSTLVYRTYTDSSASVGKTFYYFVRSQNASQALSAPSDTVGAKSAAEPFFDFVFSESGPFHIRDTIRVTARLHPVGYDPESFSLYLNYEPLMLTLLDADAGTAGVQPFVVDSTLAVNARVLQNRVEAGGSGHISYSLGFLPALPNEPVPIGTIRFVARRKAVTALRVSSDTSTIRRSALTARGDGSLILPYVPPANLLVLQNHRIRGQVTFQGRTEHLDQEARFDLTRTTGAALPDSLAYRPPNDLDLVRKGVQLNLNADGRFSLVQVRGGRYALFVKTHHYLRGRVVGDSVTVNDTSGVAAPVSFRWISSDSSIVSTALRAGDANDDNRADLADFGILSANFGATDPPEDSPAWGADFNGDGVVNLADFALLQSNFGEVGLGPALPAKPARTDARFELVWNGRSGTVRIYAPEGIAGFAADLAIPERTGGAVENLEMGAFLPGGGKSMKMVRTVERAEETVIRVAAVLRNPENGVWGEGDLFGFEIAEEAERARVRLENLQVLFPDGSVAGPRTDAGARLERPDALPERPELFQNLPNPFNPSTTIPYAVAEPARVALSVYSLLGQEIYRTEPGFQQPGYYRVAWDGKDQLGRPAASGIYFFRIEIGGFVGVKKAILLR